MKIKSKNRIISSILSITIIVTSLAIGWMTSAEVGVAINEDNFADKNFRTVLLTKYDTDGNGYLSDTERSKTIMTLSGDLHEICGNDATIETLKGIEYFTKLTRLYAGAIGLKTLDLSKNTALVYLTCEGNKLESFTLGTLPALKTLKCSSSNLTSLDVTGCTALQELQCAGNKLTTLNVNKNKNLTLLYVQQNELTNLDVSANLSLVSLYCSNNHIKELNLGNNTMLGEITTEMIGEQWISQVATINSKKVDVAMTFGSPSSVVSSSIDTREDTEEGTVVTPAFNGSSFVTAELEDVKDKLEDMNKEKHDGFTYSYSVGNSNCEPMTVNVKVSRNFYQVNFYLDETMKDRISYDLVAEGERAASPKIPDPAQCKEYVSWSEDYSSVTKDMDVYIVWRNTHNIIKSINSQTGDIDIHCSKCTTCDIKFNFLEAYNSTTGSENYVEVGDRNNDGIINAKDYAIIVNM